METGNAYIADLRAKQKWLFRKPRNSWSMGGDGDDLEVIRNVEKAFAIKIDDAEVVTLKTMGQLFDHVRSKTKVADTVPEHVLWIDLVHLVAVTAALPKVPVDRDTTFF